MRVFTKPRCTDTEKDKRRAVVNHGLRCRDSVDRLSVFSTQCLTGSDIDISLHRSRSNVHRLTGVWVYPQPIPRYYPIHILAVSRSLVVELSNMLPHKRTYTRT
ncbi:hypothetical protein LSAT2_002586 [Lamellibrachia satsuma]|nr:hypothetical protein LSAT2_002586 [Lamellibrachia satsuma]